VEVEKKVVGPEIHIQFDKLTLLPELRFGFYGRRKEYRVIRDGILYKHERAVIVHGIGGIGKTALIQHMASRLQKHFDGVCVFDCRGGALSPDVILLKLHRLLESRGIKVLEQLMNRFFAAEELGGYLGQVLSQVSLLVIFDNFETQLSEVLGETKVFGGAGTVLQKGSCPPEAKVSHIIRDQNLKTFLEVLVRTTAERSCFLFTSRYWFDIDEKRVGPIRYMALNDLSRPEALGLMQHLPFLSAASYEDKMEAYRVFGGHPYGLVTLDRHCGMRSLAEVLKDAQGVHRELREFLAIDMNYGKLTPGGRELLNRLAAFREPVEWDAVQWVMGIEEDTVGEFMKNIVRDKLPEELRQMDDAALAQLFRGMLPVKRKAEGMEPVVQELVGWGMVTPVREEEEVYLTVHSLVREFCREKSGAEWQKHLTEAAGYYTNKYKTLGIEKKTLATVLEEVEAAELLMEAENFEAAADIMIDITPLLDRWGWGRLLESLYDQVLRALPGVELKTRAIILHNLAILMQERGEYAAALEKYEQSLKIAEELGDRAGVALSLGQIGNIYQDKGDYAAALEKYEQARKVFEEIGDRKNAAGVLHQVGMIYHAKGEYAAALEKYEQARKVFEEIGDRKSASATLHQVGMIYQDKGEYAAALEKYEQSLKIKEELGDRAGVALSLGQIGNIYQDKGDYAAALEKYEQARKVFEEIGDKANVAKALHQVGNIYYLKGDYAAALEKYEQSLKIAEELGDRAGVASSLHQVGSIYHQQKKYPEAFENYLIAFSILTELGSPDAQIAENSLGILRKDWGEKEFEEALERKKVRR